MKRIISTLLILALSLVIVGCSSGEKLNQTFDTYEIETKEKISYVYYDTLVYGDRIINFEEMLDKSEYRGTFHEVYFIQGDTIWFGFSNATKNEDGSKTWHIASINADSKEINICYSGNFGLKKGADKFYAQNNNRLSEGHQVDNGFYYDGKIVLTDRTKTVEYDLQANKIAEFAASDYEYPILPIKADIIDYHTVSFSKESREKIFDVKQARQSSIAFEKLYELEQEKNWQGKPYLSELFDNVQIVDDQIYIICNVFNWNGETHAIVFQYDFDTNSCKYAFHRFMDDVIGNNLYIVPQSTDSSVIDGQKTFDIADYQNEIGFFASDKNVGPITDEETAIEKAKALWREEFGSVIGETHDTISDKKLEALFDSENDCWLIKALPPEPKEESGGYIKITLGGGLYAIIKNDGAVVAVWFED